MSKATQWPAATAKEVREYMANHPGVGMQDAKAAVEKKKCSVLFRAAIGVVREFAIAGRASAQSIYALESAIDGVDADVDLER